MRVKGASGLMVILKPNHEQPFWFPVKSHWKVEFKLGAVKFKRPRLEEESAREP